MAGTAKSFSTAFGRWDLAGGFAVSIVASLVVAVLVSSWNARTVSTRFEEMTDRGASQFVRQLQIYEFGSSRRTWCDRCIRCRLDIAPAVQALCRDSRSAERVRRLPGIWIRSSR